MRQTFLIGLELPDFVSAKENMETKNMSNTRNNLLKVFDLDNI